MQKAYVYHRALEPGIGLPPTRAVKQARKMIAGGTHLPFQRRRPDGGLDYILVRSSPLVQRLLRAINFGVFNEGRQERTASQNVIKWARTPRLTIKRPLP